MVLALWISLLGVSLVVSLTPGAGAINTMSNALAVGWRRAFWGIIGQQFGILAHILVAAAGIGVLITGSPVAFAVVRYAGAAYLIFIGLRQFFARPPVAAGHTPAKSAATQSAPGKAESETATGSVQVLTRVEARVSETELAGGSAPKPGNGTSAPTAGQLVRRGFWVNMLNPKAVVFFLAIMPQFISADLPAMPQYLIIALTMTAIDMTIMTFVFAAAAEQFRRFTGSPRGQVVSNRIFGSLFVLIAVAMLLLN
ncbi:LysE family translocator [Leucobacter sp. HY1908]